MARCRPCAEPSFPQLGGRNGLGGEGGATVTSGRLDHTRVFGSKVCPPLIYFKIAHLYTTEIKM